MESNWNSRRELVYRCEVCSDNFQSELDLLFHFDKTHVSDDEDDSDMDKMETGSWKGEEEGKGGCSKTESASMFQCPFTQNRFAIWSQFETHIRRLTGEKPFFCRGCDSSFVRVNDLTDHMKKRHPDKRLYKCNECGDSFFIESQLKAHLTTHRDQAEICRRQLQEGDKPFGCKTCGKRFASFRSLQNHVKKRGHEANPVISKRPYKCSKCDGSYLTKEHLRRHMEFHAKEKYRITAKRECETCGKLFKSKSNLSRHRKLHLPIKLFICEFKGCNAGYSRKDNYLNHYKSHLRVRPKPF